MQFHSNENGLLIIVNDDYDNANETEVLIHRSLISDDNERDMDDHETTKGEIKCLLKHP